MIFATVHEQRLGSKHLRHLGKDARSAALDEPVGEAADERIGGKPGKAVATAALKSYNQFRNRHIDALADALGLQLADEFKPALVFVAGILRQQKADIEIGNVAKALAEAFKRIVFASEPHHQHAAGIRVAAERGKEIGRHLMIVAELAATVRMG